MFEISHIETNFKSQTKNHRKKSILQNGIVDSLTKDKDELNKEKHALAKQVEEMTSSSDKILENFVIFAKSVVQGERDTTMNMK